MPPRFFSPPARNNLSYAVSLAILFPRAGYDVLRSWLIYHASSSSSSPTSSSTSSAGRHVLLTRFVLPPSPPLFLPLVLDHWLLSRCNGQLQSVEGEECAKTWIECGARADKDALENIFDYPPLSPPPLPRVSDANARPLRFFPRLPSLFLGVISYVRLDINRVRSLHAKFTGERNFYLP